MRTRLLMILAGVVAMACVTAEPAFAQGPGQDTVRGDLAISYSVLHDKELLQETFPAGLILALAADVNKHVRIIAELATNSKTINLATATNLSLQVLTYQGGIRFVSGGKAKITPFVQVLAGGARVSGILLGFGSTQTDNALSLQPGGGVDFHMTHNFDGRIQVDYRAIRDAVNTPGGTTDRQFFGQYRVAFGIVIPFGR